MNRNIPQITAHNACEDTLPDSLETVKYAIEMKVDCAEVDVRKISNGSLILSHDQTDDNENTLVRLADVFRLAQQDGKICINCDIKQKGIVSDVLNLAGDFNIPKEQLVFSGSVTPSIVRTLPDINKKASVFMNIEEIVLDIYENKFGNSSGIDFSIVTTQNRWEVLNEVDKDMIKYKAEVLKSIERLKPAAVNMPYFDITEELFSEFLNAGIPVSVWTINDYGKIKFMFELGVINLTTKKVKMAMDLRRELFGI